MELTKLEQDVIDYCIATEMTGMGLWAGLDSLGRYLNLTPQQVGGVITSLQNKKLGYVEEMGKGESSVFWLNEESLK